MSGTLRDRHLLYARTILQSRKCSIALVGETSDLEGLRVLVLGISAAETLCALMHTECRKAEARMPDAHVEARSADLVLVPHVTLVTVNRVINQAIRSLDHHGRIVIASSLNERHFIDLTVAALVQAGFNPPFLEFDDGETRIHASLGEVVARA